MEIKNKRGRRKLPVGELRNVKMEFFVNSDEATRIDTVRRQLKMTRGQYMRRSALGENLYIVPEININVWHELGKIGGNLNQLLKNINQGQVNADFDLMKILQNLNNKIFEIRKFLIEVGGEKNES